MRPDIERQTRQVCPVNTVTEQKKLSLRKEETAFPLVTSSNKNSSCSGALAHYVEVIIV